MYQLADLFFESPLPVIILRYCDELVLKSIFEQKTLANPMCVGVK